MQEDAVVEETVENAQQKAEFERAVQPPLVAMPSSLKDFAEEAGLAEDVARAQDDEDYGHENGDDGKSQSIGKQDPAQQAAMKDGAIVLPFCPPDRSRHAG